VSKWVERAEMLEASRINTSRSRKGDPWDNSVYK
jgi:hypothetical protein